MFLLQQNDGVCNMINLWISRQCEHPEGLSAHKHANRNLKEAAEPTHIISCKNSIHFLSQTINLFKHVRGFSYALMKL